MDLTGLRGAHRPGKDVVPENVEFNCTRCGLCCAVFDCPKLVFEEGQYSCSIYEDRPDICRVDYGVERLVQIGLSKEEALQKQYDGCALLQKHFGVPHNDT